MRDILRYSENTGRLRQRLSQPFCTEFGLNQKEIDILIFLYNNPERNTAKDIAFFLQIAKSNLSVLLDDLEKKGWINAKSDIVNRRVKRLSLCAERENDLRRLSAFQAKFFEIFTQGFSAEEIEALHTLLNKMNTNVLKALEKTEEKT